MNKLELLTNLIYAGSGEDFMSYTIEYNGKHKFIEVQFDDNVFNDVILWNNYDDDDINLTELKENEHPDLYAVVKELAECDYRAMMDDEEVDEE